MFKVFPPLFRLCLGVSLHSRYWLALCFLFVFVCACMCVLNVRRWYCSMPRGGGAVAQVCPFGSCICEISCFLGLIHMANGIIGAEEIIAFPVIFQPFIFPLFSSFLYFFLYILDQYGDYCHSGFFLQGFLIFNTLIHQGP